MIKKLMQFRNTIVALLGIEFILALLTYMFLQNRVTLALMIYILIKNVVCIIALYYLNSLSAIIRFIQIIIITCKIDFKCGDDIFLIVTYQYVVHLLSTSMFIMP